MIELSSYRTFVFDCDGVVLDSNKVKTEAFYRVARQFGDDAALTLVDYHVANGGISRYLKFTYLLETILGMEVQDDNLLRLLSEFAAEVKQGLLKCTVAPGLSELRRMTSDARWMIVSGGDQEELREVFARRGIDHMFDAGIFGSPANKDEILGREVTRENLKSPALFLGDSRYDHEAATRAKLDFLFVSNWSEFSGWEEYCSEGNIPAVTALDSLCA